MFRHGNMEAGVHLPVDHWTQLSPWMFQTFNTKETGHVIPTKLMLLHHAYE